MTRSNLYQRLFAGLWLLACVGLAVAGWRYQAPFSYEPVGPRAYPLLCLALMGAGLGGGGGGGARPPPPPPGPAPPPPGRPGGGGRGPARARGGG
ncbi:hypothetical protein OD784_34185, partial [Pseudomonas aeruginosa]|nr:hypothetical protein [Pseudomonas aeruginosa]